MRKFNWLFAFLTLLISLLLLEVGARVLEIFLVPEELQEVTTSPVFKKVRNSDGDSLYVRTTNHPFISSELSFPGEKSDSTVRIFCLGGSAAMGWPHDLNWSYPALLQKQLQVYFPHHSFEVINAAASTYGSFRVANIMEEVLDYEPDCVVLYTGNNEFLEPELYGSQLAAPWKFFAPVRLFSLARKGVLANISDSFPIDYQPTFMIDIALGNSSPLKTSPDKFRQVQTSFRKNLSRMIDLAEDQDVPMVLTTVPVNVRDWVPHASEHSPEVDLATWQETFSDALKMYNRGDAQKAATLFQRCIDQDTGYAKPYYYLGKTYIDLEKGAQAKQALVEALKKDAYPFRCLPAFNAIIKELTQEKKLTLVDIVQTLEDASPFGIIGEDAVVDHVHPTITSNQRISEVILPAVINLCTLPEVKIDAIKIDLLEGKPQPKITYYKHLFLIYRVLLQFDKLEELLKTLEGLPKHMKSSSEFLALQNDLDRAWGVIEPYSELMQKIEIGTANTKYEPAEIEHIVKAYIELNRYDLARNISDKQFSKFVPQPK